MYLKELDEWQTLGKVRPMPWTVIENNIKYFPKHTLYLYSSKNPYFYEYHFVINVGRRIYVCFGNCMTMVYERSKPGRGLLYLNIEYAFFGNIMHEYCLLVE